jgi:hypothetical protein
MTSPMIWGKSGGRFPLVIFPVDLEIDPFIDDVHEEKTISTPDEQALATVIYFIYKYDCITFFVEEIKKVSGYVTNYDIVILDGRYPLVIYFYII